MPDYERKATAIGSRLGQRIFLLGGPILVMFGIIPVAALLTPFFLLRIQNMREEVLIFALPGIALLLIFHTHALRFIIRGTKDIG